MSGEGGGLCRNGGVLVKMGWGWGHLTCQVTGKMSTGEEVQVFLNFPLPQTNARVTRVSEEN